jgi:F420-dependent oxidoreductase-like protein
MRFGAAFWVQRTGWPELRAAVAAAEEAGFDSVWIDDHLLADEGDWTTPKLEGWATLAGLAAVTTRVRLGLLVAANTFRNPGLTAKLATTVDHVSGGRAVLGLGGGWFEREHDAFGIDFGSHVGERLDRLAEAVPLVRRLLDGEAVTHEGRYYRMRDALCLPRPVQPHLPILIGGSGPRKTLPLVARHADIWNGYGTADRLAELRSVLDDQCAAIGRDPASLERTVTQNVIVRDDPGAALREWQRVKAAHRPREDEDHPDVVGDPAAIAAELGRYRGVGIDESVWVFRAPFDLETMSRLAEVRALL